MLRIGIDTDVLGEYSKAGKIIIKLRNGSDSMPVIQTVCGKISPEALGFCHSHEHITIANGKCTKIDPALRIDDFGKSMQELLLFKSVGGCAIVDCQPVGAGRISQDQARLSEESGIHIVSSTGFHKMNFYEDDHWIFIWDEKAIEELFVHELTVGMYLDTETKIPNEHHSSKAGVIKVAFDTPGLSQQYKKLFTAAARAGVKTNASLIIHIENGTNPIELDDFLGAQGVASEKRIYCHMDRAVSDIGTHIELCRRGSYMEYDTICRVKYHEDNAEIDIIKKVLDAGFEDSLLLGLDATNKRLKAYGSEFGLDYIKETFIPQMWAAGITPEQTDKFMVQNPAKAFRIG